MVLPLLKTSNYFIDTKGFVFKIENGKEVKAKIKRHHQSNEVYVRVNGKFLNLLNLMIQHFLPEVKATQQVSHKVLFNDTIPLHTIKVKSILSEWISQDDERLMVNFNCSKKAASANMRCDKKITALQVFLTLKINKYQCVYCACMLKENDWHLEHYIPLSKSGKNVFENLLPSCSVCNFMKGSLDGQQFYKQCTKIYKNFAFKPS